MLHFETERLTLTTKFDMKKNVNTTTEPKHDAKLPVSGYLKMNIHTLKSRTVCHNSERFLLMVGHRHWSFGIQIQDWGIRFMLIWWHVCIHL